MPKKKKRESQDEQSARFRAETERLNDVGELNPIAAEQAIDKILERERLVRKVEE